MNDQPITKRYAQQFEEQRKANHMPEPSEADKWYAQQAILSNLERISKLILKAQPGQIARFEDTIANLRFELEEAVAPPLGPDPFAGNPLQSPPVG